MKVETNTLQIGLVISEATKVHKSKESDYKRNLEDFFNLFIKPPHHLFLSDVCDYEASRQVRILTILGSVMKSLSGIMETPEEESYCNMLVSSVYDRFLHWVDNNVVEFASTKVYESPIL